MQLVELEYPNEHFLHYIWKYQKFSQESLSLTNGAPLQIFQTGLHNDNAGPDFLEAKIKIGDIEWMGQVEVHMRASDWIAHKHQDDPAYRNVVLHVVWHEDETIFIDNEAIPTLALSGKVDIALIKRYQQHLLSKKDILCASQLSGVSSFTIHSMLDAVLVERLEQKAEKILQLLGKHKNDWEAITYHTLASNFGFSINKVPFTELAAAVPYQVLAKNLHNPINTEALLFGAAGFLSTETSEAYQLKLTSEYQYLTKKYGLDRQMNKSQWKFARTRPGNFPTVRLAQFASLLTKYPKLFAILSNASKQNEILQLLQINTSEYWQHHYDFGKPRSKQAKGIGQKTAENLIINMVAPLLAAYSKHTGKQELMDSAVALLEKLQGESNRITKQWTNLNVEVKTAFDSQAVIQLYKNYCLKKRCLSCKMGVEILG